jgi:hypothetical protein
MKGEVLYAVLIALPVCSEGREEIHTAYIHCYTTYIHVHTVYTVKHTYIHTFMGIHTFSYYIHI